MPLTSIDFTPAGVRSEPSSQAQTAIEADRAWPSLSRSASVRSNRSMAVNSVAAAASLTVTAPSRVSSSQQLRSVADRFANAPAALHEPLARASLLRRMVNAFGPHRTRQQPSSVRSRPYQVPAPSVPARATVLTGGRASVSARYDLHQGQWQPSHHRQGSGEFAVPAPPRTQIAAPATASAALAAGIARAAQAYQQGGSTADFLSSLGCFQQTLEVVAAPHLTADEVHFLRGELHRAAALIAAGGGAR